jgi:ribosomal protein L24E
MEVLVMHGAPGGALAVRSDGDCFDFCRRQ